MAGYFSHLHVRSGFSYGLGTATPEELAEGAARLGYRALALTDRDGLYGIPRFLAACEKHGLSPMAGAEIAVEPRKGGLSGHVVLLCESQQGYRSLCKLISAYRIPGEGAPWPSAAERRNPACPLETLLSHTEGLVCLTGAIPFGLVPGLALSQNTDSRGKSRAILSTLREAFGAESIFVELTDDGTKGSRGRMREVEALAERLSLPTVAAHEVTYLRPEDHRLSEALAAASALSALPSPNFRPTDRLYLRSPARMGKLFSDRPQALANAAAIAERCAGAIRLSGEVLMPRANLREGEVSERKLMRLAVAGARELYPDSFGGVAGTFPSKVEIKTRLRREISCIRALDFIDYFLIAREAADLARENGVLVTGRGSAANSLVAHCLHLTTPDPFEHRLLFERFLHEGRTDPPDIDLDFDSEYRDESVRDELMRRYSHLGCGITATAQTFSLRGAVRIAAKALGYSPPEIDALAKNVPRRVRDRDRLVNYQSEWDAALSSPAMRRSPLQDRRRYALLLDLAEKLEGRLARQGTHPGGLVLGTSERHLTEIVPLEPAGKDGLVRTQYDKDDLEAVGIPKLDLLGLKMHTALRKAGELVGARLGREVAPLSPAFALPNDRKTYELIRAGDTAGVFQLESPGQMSLQRGLKPRRLEHIVSGI